MIAADEDLVFAGPAALAESVRNRQIQPRELVELFLRRIEALDPQLNAFRVTMPEEALAAADQAAVSGGLLTGVPIAVKDEMAVKGQFLTRGSRSYGPRQSADSEIVRRLRGAGAIPIGITNVPELMTWPWTASDANGITRNPWDPTRTPGGSSGGSAAAVAAGMVPAATAADGGGSIRIPASCCGLVGMKPTRGRVSLQPLDQDWLGLTVYGGLARTVADSGLMLDAIQGPMAGDADVAVPFEGSYADAAVQAPARLRIAASHKIPPGVIASLSADQRRGFDDTVHLLADLGHELSERDPAYGVAGLLFTQIWVRGVYEAAESVPDRSQLERYTRQYVRAGRYLVPGRRRERLIRSCGGLRDRILRLWDDVDVLLTPGLASTAIAAEGGYGKSAPAAFNVAARFSPWTATFNLTGQPAVTVPAGWGSDGLPLSVQLVGRMGAEDVLYSLAGQIEAARPWADRKPPLAVGAGAVQPGSAP